MTHLQDFSRHLVNALCNRPTVHGFEGDYFEDQQVQCSLYKLSWFAQVRSLLSVTDKSMESSAPKVNPPVTRGIGTVSLNKTV